MTDMQQTGRPTGSEPVYSESTEVTGWVGWIIFASVMMFMIGSFQAIAGLVALFDDEYYLVRSSGLVVNVDYTAWGWVHLLFGILLIATGLGAIAGQTWARVVGVILAGLSAVVNFAFLAAYPVWSAIVITLDVFVIYALVVHGREARALR
jgi:hypothetical protein